MPADQSPDPSSGPADAELASASTEMLSAPSVEYAPTALLGSEQLDPPLTPPGRPRRRAVVLVAVLAAALCATALGAGLRALLAESPSSSAGGWRLEITSTRLVQQGDATRLALGIRISGPVEATGGDLDRWTTLVQPGHRALRPSFFQANGNGRWLAVFAPAEAAARGRLTFNPGGALARPLVAPLPAASSDG